MVIRMKTILQEIKKFHDHGATLLLSLLLAVDLGFILLHSIEALAPFWTNPMFSIEKDGTFPEVYQYVKYFWIILLLFYNARNIRAWGYVAWAAAFTYFLCDDALRIHENVGIYFTQLGPFTPPLHLRMEDLGELAISFFAGLLLFCLIAWAWQWGSEQFKKCSRDILFLILVLLFFGLGVDMLHIMLRPGWQWGFVLGVLEDGGEMLTVSLILWYVFLLALRKEATGLYLWDVIKKRF
jgi:hypothetical protein